MIKKSIFIAVLIGTLTGCAAVSYLSEISRPTAARGAAATPIPPMLDRQKSVFVTVPEDGGSASLWYVGSGRVVAAAVADAFSRKGISVYVSGRQMTSEDAVATAAGMKAGYAVRPVITWWEPRNEWLGNPSKLNIRVVVIEVPTGRVIASEPVASHTLLASITNQAPDVLLAVPLSRYVNTLY